MEKTKNLFLGLAIAIIMLFIGCCASIFVCIFNNFSSESGNVMALVYLFLHLIVLAGVFYFAFRAFYTGKSLVMRVFMVDEKGEPIKRSKIVAIVIASLFFLIGVYGTLLVTGLDMPLAFFSETLKYAIMNVGYSVGVVGLFFILYPLVFKKEIN